MPAINVAMRAGNPPPFHPRVTTATALSLPLALSLAAMHGCATSERAGIPTNRFDESSVDVTYDAYPASPYDRLEEALARANEFEPRDPFAAVNAENARGKTMSDGGVQWLDLKPQAPATVKRQPQVERNEPEPTPAPIEQQAPQTEPAPSADTFNEPEPEPATHTKLSRRELLEKLLTDLKASHTSAMRQALAAVVATTLGPNGEALEPAELDQRFLEPLTDSERRVVLRYHQLLTELHASLAATDADGVPLPGDLVNRHLGDVAINPPVDVRRVELCTRVDGFGVYEPFAAARFTAGRPQRMIVYAEVDDFDTRESGGQFEVRLRQQIELYNEADGLIVWRRPAVDVVDHSRNRRRDFFVVQMVELPANLSVGKYRLGIRIIDLADQSQDEIKLPIEIVADTNAVAQTR